MSDLYKKIQAVLFFKNEPVSVKKLAELLNVSKDDAQQALTTLEESLADAGVVLIRNEDKVMLGTAPEFSKMIEDLQKEELNRDLSKASLETLSVILYKNGASRAEIDYIRGVNSSFTLRALSVRGLIEKEIDPKDSRRYIYKPTFELLGFLGVKSTQDLPEYQDIMASLEKGAQDLASLAEKESEKSDGGSGE